jgi:hypothetical protein
MTAEAFARPKSKRAPAVDLVGNGIAQSPLMPFQHQVFDKCYWEIHRAAPNLLSSAHDP